VSRRSGLGRGLAALIPPSTPEPSEPVSERPDEDATGADEDEASAQTDEDADNFGRYLSHEMHLPTEDQRNYVIGNRTIRIGTFPVGVDTAEFARMAQDAVRSTVVRKAIESLSGRAMVIGVDRLDYSKGLTQRMDAFEKFLATYPGWRAKVTYLQITPKSRSTIP
jgi:trehalose 6-phosphate synthase